MPAYLKTIICLIVAAVAALVYYAGINAREIVLGIAVLMVVAIWMFPEASGGERINRLTGQNLPQGPVESSRHN